MGRWSNQDPNISSPNMGYRALGLAGAGPDELFWSYSTGRMGIGTCSATFVGPHLLLGAGHCGWPSPVFITAFYSEGSPFADIQETVSCETLIENHTIGDFRFMWCDSVSTLGGRQIPPGEVFGMGEFDFEQVSLDQEVWSSWWNKDCYGQTPSACREDVLVYSPGIITGFNPQGPSVEFFQTNQRVTFGASGSAVWTQIDGSDHRIVGAGLATLGCGMDSAGCKDSNRASMKDLLAKGDMDYANNTNGMDLSILQNRGLVDSSRGWSFDDYKGPIDSHPKDGFFDVMTRLDEVYGINGGDTAWLGFESPRRNHMWQVAVPADVTFYDKSRFVWIDYSGPGNETVMTMPKVVTGGYSQRVSVMINTDTAGSPTALSIEFEGATATGQQTTSIDIPTVPTGGWVMHTDTVTLPALDVEIRIKANSDFQGSLSSLTFVTQNSWNHFGTHSERLNWRNNETGERAWILPHGMPRYFDSVGWAGLVFDQDQNTQYDYTLRNRQLAIDPNDHYLVCFHVRSYPASANAAGDGIVEVGSGASGGNQNAFQYVFPLTPSWTYHCSPPLQAAGSDSLLKFGHIQGNPNYLVDSVRLVQQ